VRLGRLWGSKQRIQTAMVWLAAIAAACVGTAILAGLLGLRFNLTPSLPMGVYVVARHRRSELVEFCPEGIAGSLSVARSYRLPGACPDHAAPLLKPIVARAGDVVEVSRNGIAVNGHLLPNSAPQSTDSQGRRLTAWPAGSYRVALDTVWVVSSYNPRSFDSRYYGPISTTSIRHHLVPLWTF
jgi:conjugative transfer signal peptidase TraF